MKHLIYVQIVWFIEAVTATPRQDLALSEIFDESFVLSRTDTIDSVRAQYTRGRRPVIRG